MCSKLVGFLKGFLKNPNFEHHTKNIIMPGKKWVFLQKSAQGVGGRPPLMPKNPTFRPAQWQRGIECLKHYRTVLFF